MADRREVKFVAICVLSFLLLGMFLVPLFGIQNDEALGANALYPPFQFAWALETPVGSIPLMIASYAGCLKMWLFAAIFSFWPPGIWSLRLPGILLGMATIGCFYTWVRDAYGSRTARYACLLLSFDFSFLVTNTFDWGPVALQHITLVFGLMAFHRYYQSKYAGWLAAGSFAFGLGVWDKALFASLLFGVVAAALAVYRREFLKCVRRRRAVPIAVLSFVAGASPLILYNLANGGQTAVENAGIDLSAEMVIYKLNMMSNTLDGSALYDYMLRNSTGSGANPYQSDSTPSTPMPILFVASVLLACTLPRSPRFLKWSVMTAIVSYLPFVVGDGFGGGSHHAVLLWPLPHLAVALALTDEEIWSNYFQRAREIAFPALLIAVTLIGNGAMYVGFVDRGRRYGPTAIWTDAISELNKTLGSMAARRVVVLDWGMHDSLRLLSQGELPLTMGVDPFLSSYPSPNMRELAAGLITEEGSYFVDHTRGNRVFPEVRRNFDHYIDRAGLHAVPIAVVPDRLGKVIFEVFCVQSGQAPVPVVPVCRSECENAATVTTTPFSTAEAFDRRRTRRRTSALPLRFGRPLQGPLPSSTALRHGCPIKSRTESVGYDQIQSLEEDRVNRNR